MSKLRIAGTTLLLIYAPFLITLFFNLVPPFTTYDVGAFLKTAVFVGFYLSILFLSFIVVLQALPKKVWPLYTGFFTFSYLVLVFGFYCLFSSEAPDFAGLLLNASTVPTLFLLRALWLVCIITGLLMMIMRADKKTTAYLVCAAIVFSSGLVAARELRFRYRMANFFGDYREGQIAFVTSYTTNPQAYFFCLKDLKFRQCPKEEFEQIRKKIHYSEAFSPDANFKAYEYAYDRDDLSKIFVTQVRIGRTILLAAGANPIWLGDK